MTVVLRSDLLGQRTVLYREEFRHPRHCAAAIFDERGEAWRGCESFAKKDDPLCATHAAQRDGVYRPPIHINRERERFRRRWWHLKVPNTPPHFYLNERFGK